MGPAREVEGRGRWEGRHWRDLRGRRWTRLLLALPLVGAVIALPLGPAWAASGKSGLPLNVSPSTNLTGGEAVTITGSGYVPSSIGNVLECNDAPGQPTVDLPEPVGSTVSVSCNLIGYAHLVTVTSSGTLNATWNVYQGTVGPPCGTGGVITTCPTDSAGHSAAADAALYPCPPTAAQQAAGDVCQLSYGDDNGDESVSTTILFSGEQPPGSTTTTSTPAATTTTTHPVTTATTVPTTTATTVPTTTATTTAPSTTGTSSSATTTGPLASTGPGPDLWVVAIIGFVALYLGCITMALVDRPRNLLRRLSRRPVPAAAGDGGMAPDTPTEVHAAVIARPDVGPARTDVGTVHLDAGALLGGPDVGPAGSAVAVASRAASAMGMRSLPHRPGAWSASPDARPWSAAPDPRPGLNTFDPRSGPTAAEGASRRFVPAAWRGVSRNQTTRPSPHAVRPPGAGPQFVANPPVTPSSGATQSAAPPAKAPSAARPAPVEESRRAPAGLWLDGWAPER